jgi:hypothetical protein
VKISAERVLAVAILIGAGTAAFVYRDPPPVAAGPLVQNEASFRADRYSRGCKDPISPPSILIDDLENKADVVNFPAWSITLDDETSPEFGVAHGLTHLLIQRKTKRSSMDHNADGFLELEAFVKGDTTTCPW